MLRDNSNAIPWSFVLGSEARLQGYKDLYYEITRTGGKVSQIDFWIDNNKTTKVCTTTLTRTLGKVSTITEEVYKKDGITVLSTVTTTLTRDSGKVISVDTVRS